MRYLLAIGLLAAFLLGWLPAGLVVPALFCLSLWRPRNPRRAGLYLRRGGSETPPASPGTNQVTTSTTPLTRRVEDYSSLNTGRGVPWVVSATPRTLLGVSKPTVRGSSGAALAGRLGLLDLSAASEPPCGCPETAA